MLPIYDHNGISVYHGDCLEVMAGLPDQSFDAIITDPPYGTTACPWDTVIPFAPMWGGLKRLIKPRGAIVLFGVEPFSSLLRVSNLDWYKYDWVWGHNSPKGQNAKHQPVRIHENMLVFSDGMCGNGTSNPMVYNPQGLHRIDKVRNEPDGGPTRNHRPGRAFVRRVYTQEYTNYPQSIIHFNADSAQHQRLHPTQKPVALLEYLVRTYTDPGDTILDFTMGSGTTLLAAKNFERKAVGIELEERYCEVAIQRLSQEVMELSDCNAQNGTLMV